MTKNFIPLPQQVAATNWLIPRNEAALFSGMGLGKTAATLSALDYLFSGLDIKGALIVAPLRVSVLTWPHEVKKWKQFEHMKIVSLRTKAGLKAWHSHEAHIYTINYESLPKICRSLLSGQSGNSLPVDTIIFDELSAAKNPSSKRINGFRKHHLKFTKFWGLTGTPTPNGLKDLFAQIRLLDGGKRFGLSASQFQQTYLVPIDPYSQYPKYKTNPLLKGVVEKRIEDLALVQRSEDYLDIPPVRIIDFDVPFPASAKVPYKELEKELLTLLRDNTEVVAVNLGVLAMKLLQVTGGAVYDQDRNVGYVHDAKIKALKKLQKQEEGHPLLVAYAFQHERDRILEAFPEAELFDEKTTMDRWNRGEIPMLIAHPKSIGHGLNMQDGGSRAVWFTLTWGELYDQFNARLARTGQIHETKIFRLMIQGTIDDAVAEALEKKEDEQSTFLSTLKNIQELKLAS